MLNFSIKLGRTRVVAKPNAMHNMWTVPVCVVLGRFHVFELLSPARLLCIVLYYFLELCSTIPLKFNVGASSYTCFVTLGLGRGLRFAFVSFCKWVS